MTTPQQPAPPADKLIFETQCRASWQVDNAGGFSTVQCRVCGVYVQAGGTPKCLMEKK